MPKKIGINMEWTITLDEENKYAAIVTRGIADRDGSLEMAKEISMILGKEKIKRILVDHRNISSVSGKPVDIYSRPKEFKEIGAIPGIIVAVVVKSDYKAFFRFFETVCVNRGYVFSTFDDKKSALECYYHLNAHSIC